MNYVATVPPISGPIENQSQKKLDKPVLNGLMIKGLRLQEEQAQEA